ncbi:MAG: hypothetical protein WDN49_23195 [Acetobacteraceae bacterium]
MPLAVARAGLVSHGLALAHTHVRLNAAQLHNAVRVRLGLADPPAGPRRAAGCCWRRSTRRWTGCSRSRSISAPSWPSRPPPCG